MDVSVVFDDPNWLRNLILEMTCTNSWFFPITPQPVNTPVSLAANKYWPIPVVIFPTNEAEGYGLLNQHGGPPGWLKESDPAGVILYVMDGPYRLPFPYRTVCPDRTCQVEN
jgi:hypothetical protein